MPSPTNLHELYVEEMRDLWSANDQMQNIMAKMSDLASDAKLKALLERSVAGIKDHTETLASMVAANTDEGASHCSAMEGLVAEVTKHALATDLPPVLRDLEIITQYQRMSHYGIAGFGTAAAYASALGLSNDATELKAIVSDIYKADEYTSELAERAEAAAAASG